MHNIQEFFILIEMASRSYKTVELNLNFLLPSKYRVAWLGGQWNVGFIIFISFEAQAQSLLQWACVCNYEGVEWLIRPNKVQILCPLPYADNNIPYLKISSEISLMTEPLSLAPGFVLISLLLGYCGD